MLVIHFGNSSAGTVPFFLTNVQTIISGHLGLKDTTVISKKYLEFWKNGYGILKMIKKLTQFPGNWSPKIHFFSLLLRRLSRRASWGKTSWQAFVPVQGFPTCASLFQLPIRFKTLFSEISPCSVILTKMWLLNGPR